ncbi:RING finger domain-containing protein [Akanthomyces lecanii RCEF 1005]|uniref:RING finger domain-containing protein n=1 Tax=Akanthomyces lecanii RCEF 1005 TaxID=1081108 RepID=A0A168JV00_CORDF|nr:RING finger domain-containing protein [Akanthomyces lecanii RCEF 1005]
MDDEVNVLTLKPFRDVVEEASTALENAGENDVMRKAAKKLLREGEKAVKLIEPQCTKRLAEYGDNFLNALRENEEIKGPRANLGRLVYGFDEYVDEDEFEADKYTELQALTREVALKIYEVLISMRLEMNSSKDNPQQSFLNEFSPPSSPHPPPNFPVPPTPPRSSVQSATGAPSSPLPGAPRRAFQSVQYANEELESFRDRQPGSVLGPEDEPLVSPSQLAPPPQQPPPPRPPSANPWDTTIAGSNDEIAVAISGEPLPRRPLVAPPSPRPPSNSATSPVSPGQHRLSPALQRRPIASPSVPPQGDPDAYPYDEAEWRRLTNQQYGRQPHSPQPSPSHLNTRLEPFPEEGSYQEGPENDQSVRGAKTTHHTHQVSLESGSVAYDHDPQRDTFGGAPQRRSRTESVAESILDPYLNNVRISDHSQESSRAVDRPPMIPTQNVDDGLIVVESDSRPSEPAPARSRKDCSIGNNSSFYLCKGFCNGAEEVIMGGLGVKKQRRPVGFTGTATVARCTSCVFELSFQDIENDLGKQNSGNLRQSNVGYRLRFLQKSHIQTKRPDDILYGCLFCIRLGRTMDPSDATVFFNVKSLFNHLARHPRPLPDIPGVVIIDGPDVPEQYRNDYDLHFTKPPVPHPALEHEQETAMMPTGVAKEPARRMYGQRLLADRTPALELVVGSKVTGLSWPSKYNGEWCMGWYDGVNASVPLEALRLDPPPSRDIKMDGTSHVRAKSRWKFSHKDKDKTEWLKFDKDEIITNISWVYPEHWCWSGTNSKGKWGIFPQAFLDTNTVQELSAVNSQRASSLSSEKNKSASILPRFSVRKTQGPPSIASSRS